jgi:hypothetical protein
VKRTVYYQGKRYDIRLMFDGCQVTIWQGTIITPESGSRHEFYFNHR